FVERTAEIAKGGRIPFSRLTPEDARARHPQLAIRDGDLVGYEPTGGVVLSERAIAAQLRLARALGAQTLVNEPVSNVEFGSASATVVTSQGRHTAAKVIVTAGAWMPEFMPETRRELLRVTRQTVHWFAVDEPERFFPDNFSAAVWAGDRLEDYLGVFPIIPDGILALKILTEQYEETTDPNTTDRTVHAEESAHFFNTLVSDRLKGVTPNCVKASACLYTHTPNDHFLIDWHPDCQHVLLASPCSSHGFKHSAAIGEALMQTATMGRSDLDLSSFSLAQFD
ncbi:MAG: FAD-dependent oxidoreductase, partial [Pseudomonadota bacterium]